MRSSLIVGSVSLSLCLGPACECGGADDAPAPSVPAELPVTSQLTTSEAPAETADDEAPTGAFDVRLLRVEPGRHVGTEQVCDLAFVGRLSPVQGREARRYEVPAVHRMSIRCRADTGEGWADLIFGEQAAATALEITRDKRIRVRVHSADGGFGDYPILELVELVGDAPDARGRRSLYATVNPAFDFSRLSDEASLVGTTQECGVAFAGNIELIDELDRDTREYPGDAQNHVLLKCKHAQGQEWVDVTFTADDAASALAVARGATVSVRILNTEGGYARYPVAAYVADED